MSGLPLDTDYNNIYHGLLQLASCYAGCSSVPRVGTNCLDSVCINVGDYDEAGGEAVSIPF